MSELEAIFLDRDGTVIEDAHYLGDPDKARLIPGAGEALALAVRSGLRLFLVTNQSGVGRGYFSEADYLSVRRRVNALLAAHGAAPTDEAFCPHAPHAQCACRKPGLGQWEELASRHGLTAARCAMVGDKASDAAFGLAAGMWPTVLVLTGHGREQAARLGLAEPEGPWREISPRAPGQPHVLARDLPAAVQAILALAGRPAP